MPKNLKLIFKELCENFFKINRDVEAIIVSDVDGLIIFGEKRENIDIEIISVLTSIVNPVLERLRDEFAFQQFGTASFNTEDHRLLFISVIKDITMSLVINPMASIDKVTSYAYFLAEKTAQFLTAEEDEIVQLVIPKFEYETREIDRLNNQIYQTKLEHGKKYRFKFIIIGDNEVGKTSIVRRFTENRFSHDYRATLGLNLLTHSINFTNNEIELYIWDIGAQKYFKPFRKTYYRGAQAVFIVFDLTNMKSFNNIIEWYNEIVDFVKKEELSVVIVGNKSDLKNQRVIDYEKGIEITNLLYEKGLLNLSYIETSALTGENIKEAFHLISYNHIIKDKEFEEELLKDDIRSKINSIISLKKQLTISFITEYYYWSLGLQILAEIASEFKRISIEETKNQRLYEYENGLVIKYNVFDHIEVTNSDAVFCIFDARNKQNIESKWKLITKQLIESIEANKVILIGIRVDENTSWSNIMYEFDINKYLKKKTLSLLFVKIGKRYRIEIFDQLKVMFNTIENTL